MRKIILSLLLLFSFGINISFANNCKYVEGKKYDNIDFFSLKYSSDGKSFAYLVKKDGKEIVIKDGKESKKYNNIQDFKYSPDSKSFIYVAIKDGKWILVKDGKESKKYDDIRYYSLKYSPNFKSFAFKAEKDGKWILVKDGKEINRYGEIFNFQYSLDGKIFTFIAKKDGKYFVVQEICEDNLSLGKENIICKNLVGCVGKLLSPKIRNFRYFFKKST